MDNAIVQAVADYAKTVLGKEGFHTLAFLDGVIEHLSDATPV